MSSPFKSQSGIQRIAKAWTYSWQGLRAAWQHEHAFRQELFLFLPLALVAFLLPVSAWERLWLLIPMGWVLVVELLNSAIEAVVDLVSPEFHELAKRAKDLGSAAVLLSLLMLAAVWTVVLWQLLAR
jgi:diacylglycerol kinase (ATP)